MCPGVGFFTVAPRRIFLGCSHQTCHDGKVVRGGTRCTQARRAQPEIPGGNLFLLMNPGDSGSPRGPPPPLPSDPGNKGRGGNGRPRQTNNGRPPPVTTRERQRTIPKMGKKLEGHNFMAWAKSLKMLMNMFPVECNYRYNMWHIIERTLMYNQEEFIGIWLDKDEWYKANYFALLTMKRNCEEEPDGLIELCDYAFEAYEILQTHYENRMVSDLGVIISGVTKSSYSENITIEAHIQDFEQKWKKMATIGNVDQDNQEFTQHIQGIGRLESAKKAFLLMTFPTHIPRYA